MDRAAIVKRLQERLHQAQARCDWSFHGFREALKTDGVPHPDGSFRIAKASQEYRQSLLAVTKAASELTDYLVHGTIPPEDDSQ